jgi:hypothetical protein
LPGGSKRYDTFPSWRLKLGGMFAASCRELQAGSLRSPGCFAQNAPSK